LIHSTLSFRFQHIKTGASPKSVPGASPKSAKKRASSDIYCLKHTSRAFEKTTKLLPQKVTKKPAGFLNQGLERRLRDALILYLLGRPESKG